MSITQIHKAIHRIMASYGVGGSVYLYLLTGDRVALVDTGVADSPREYIQPALAEIGMSLSDIDLVLNTHAHLDHVGGNMEIKAASQAQVYIHSADLPLAQSTDAQVEFMTAPLRVLGLPEPGVQERAAYIRKMTGEAAGADMVLSAGDTVDLGRGIALRVVHNPGHTPGSISYYWESEGVLLSGDGVQGLGARPGDTPYYFNAGDYRRSLAALERLSTNILCMSHAYCVNGVVKDATRRGEEAKAFVMESAEIADTIHRAVVEAVRQMPGASKLEIARGALAELIYFYPLLLVRETRMPRSAGATILAHIEAALSGSYPM
jgi:glyoxylase-like metal-dependent hydrolase (beta-lactamase superfamily II)